MIQLRLLLSQLFILGALRAAASNHENFRSPDLRHLSGSASCSSVKKQIREMIDENPNCHNLCPPTKPPPYSCIPITTTTTRPTTTTTATVTTMTTTLTTTTTLSTLPPPLSTETTTTTIYTTTTLSTTTTTTTIYTTTTLSTTRTTTSFGTVAPENEVQWFVYRKHYMGVPMIGVFGGRPIRPEDAEQKYVFWAKNLEQHAPKLTHLYYAFWDLSEQCHVEDTDPDASWYGAFSAPSWITPTNGACKGLMNDMMGLKTRFPHLKLLLSLGGWTYSRWFSKCTSTAENIEMVYRTTAFRFNEMDPDWGRPNAIWNGVDFDWEFPESATGLFPDHSDQDWDNYVKLIKYFRNAAAAEGRHHVVLSSAIGVGHTFDRLVAKPAVTKAFCDNLEHVNLMTYDIHGKWDPTTGHNAPFCKDTRAGDPSMDVTVLDVIEKFHHAGCVYKKIHIGFPNYAPAWTLIDPGQHGNGLFVRATSSNQFAGWSTFSDADADFIPQGLITHWDMKDTLSQYPDFQVHSWNCPANRGHVIPIKHVYSQQRRAWASYEDEEVVKKKAQWSKDRGLGGFFFWDAQQDKHGDLLNAGRDGWGSLPVHSATGSYTCHDHRKPRFERESHCQRTNRSLSFSNGISSCFEMREATRRVCNGLNSFAIGGQRSNGNTCLILCSPDFSAGLVGPWAGDIVFFHCEGEPLANPGPGDTETGGGGQGGGGGTSNMIDCRSCSHCVANKSSHQAVSDSDCAPCAGGQQTWWPCDLGTDLCHCA